MALRRRMLVSVATGFVLPCLLGGPAFAGPSATRPGSLRGVLQPVQKVVDQAFSILGPPAALQPVQQAIDQVFEGIGRPPASSCVVIEAAYADAMPTASNVSNLEQATVCLVNDLRTQNGLPALTVDSQLTNAARGHSQDMVDNKYFAHESPSGSTPRTRIAGKYGWYGENIAWGQGSLGTPRNRVNAWFNEVPPNDGHRLNILQTHFTATGVGVVYGAPENGRPGSATYTQDFGGPQTD